MWERGGRGVIMAFVKPSGMTARHEFAAAAPFYPVTRFAKEMR
jgi:hypothetical protein